MTTKFTPGHVVSFDRISTVYDCGCVCEVKGDINRVLLCAMHASAPDLYAALAAVVACVDRPGGSIRTVTAEAIIEARAALKRARGEE